MNNFINSIYNLVFFIKLIFKKITENFCYFFAFIFKRGRDLVFAMDGTLEYEIGGTSEGIGSATR